MLEVELFGERLRNPVMAASGTMSYGELLELPYGVVVVKGLSLEPMDGNPQPRLLEVDCGLINSVGLENIGIEAFLKEKAPYLEDRGVKYAVNILGNTLKEYLTLYEKLCDTKALFVEFNVSCPNVEKGGALMGYREDLLRELSREIERSKSKPVAVKIPPILGDEKLKRTVDALYATDMLVVANTYPSMAFSWEKGFFVRGGLSGPAIRPITLRMVHEIVKITDKPVAGVGGIKDWRSLLEYFFAGAKFVQVGTLNLLEPWKIVDILKDVEAYLSKSGFSHIWEVIGIEGVDSSKT